MKTNHSNTNALVLALLFLVPLAMWAVSEVTVDNQSAKPSLVKVGGFTIDARDHQLVELRVANGGSSFVALRQSGQIVSGTFDPQSAISIVGELQDATQLVVDCQGQRCAVASDKDCEIYDLKTRKRVATKAFQSKINLVGFSQKGDVLAVDLKTRSCLFWSFTGQKDGRELAVKATPIRFIHGSDDLLGIASGDVQILKHDSGTIAQSFNTGERSLFQEDLCSSSKGLVLVGWNDSNEMDMPSGDASAIVRSPLSPRMTFTSKDGDKWHTPALMSGKKVLAWWQTSGNPERAKYHGPKDLALYSTNGGARKFLRFPPARIPRDAEFISDGGKVAVLDMEIDRQTIPGSRLQVPTPPALVKPRLILFEASSGNELCSALLPDDSSPPFVSSNLRMRTAPNTQVAVVFGLESVDFWRITSAK